MLYNTQTQNCGLESCLESLPLHPFNFDSQTFYTPNCSVSIPIGLYVDVPFDTVS